MKRTVFSFLAVLSLLTAVFISGCSTNKPEEVSARFAHDDTGYVGTALEFDFSQASGEYITLYPGEARNNWSSYPDYEASGGGLSVTTEKYPYAYSAAGTYRPVVVSISYGNWGEKSIQAIDSSEVVITDNRNSLTYFSIPFFIQELGFDEAIISGDTIIQYFPEGNEGSYPVEFVVSSPDAKFYAGTQLLVNKETEVDFSQSGLIFKTEAPNGDTHEYILKKKFVTLKSGNSLLSFELTSPVAVTATITHPVGETPGKIAISVPAGTNLANVKMKATASDGAKVTVRASDGAIKKTISASATTVNPFDKDNDYVIVRAENLSEARYNFEFTFSK